MKHYILFDLDGTLTDPAEGITNSIVYALGKFGIKVCDKKELYKFIGPPLHDSFVNFYGFSNDDANLAITYYREYFAPKGLYENTVYDGIRELLRELNDKNVKLVLATSKPERFAREILSHFSISEYFYGIVGATMDEKRNTKGAVIAHALKTYGIDPKDAVMVGDRSHDVNGAKENALECVGVLYGFGSKEELVTSGADIIAGDVSQLKEILFELTV